MPCPCGASKEPMTLPALSKWIIDGGRVQQSATGGVSSACSSTSRRSFGRFSTQTLSSLSTARPVTPPIFHLFGSGFGHVGSNRYRGAADACASASWLVVAMTAAAAAAAASASPIGRRAFISASEERRLRQLLQHLAPGALGGEEPLDALAREYFARVDGAARIDGNNVQA